MKNSHFVFKREDIEKAGIKLDLICNNVQRVREEQGKSSNPTYLVINTDEAYAVEVIEILKRHGHWEGE
jgi:hypothetical protein